MNKLSFKSILESIACEKLLRQKINSSNLFIGAVVLKKAELLGIDELDLCNLRANDFHICGGSEFPETKHLGKKKRELHDC